MKCTRCLQRPALSFGTVLCDVCLYADAMPAKAVERQVLIPEAERKRAAADKRAKRKAGRG